LFVWLVLCPDVFGWGVWNRLGFRFFLESLILAQDERWRRA
jgi:hypothetical protein